MIIQGANEPIVINFNMDISSFTEIHIALVNKKSKKVLKHWSKADVVIDGELCICPLTQQDTIQMPTGDCFVEVKWLDEKGSTVFAKPLEDRILNRSDKDIMKGAD